MSERASASSDLATRVVTALVLGALVIAVLASASTSLWALVVLAFALLASWEAARLVAREGSWRVFAATAVVVLAAAGLALSWPETGATRAIKLWISLALFYWLFFAPAALRRARIETRWPHGALTVALVLGSAVLAAILLHRIGVIWLVAVLLIAIVADVAGYFIGRGWGRVALAPQISPKKTIEGAAGGVVAAALWSALAADQLELVRAGWQLLVAGAVGAALGALSVLGDLWESQLKRQAGVKDASGLLPGHGGVLDRIDAQLPVLPAAAGLVIALG
ncbi:MAG: phosphatidate cytidylyltransferase [Casimicrobiaceae bacterium]|nr:phosphatidate cytidylyltransferase [Casimicrobiaceae bacterium]MCX8098957.1 phosphatidate cytidylyltransferase [Casimicrobiaceae bacterium]MDW8312473.1 phosphatidate cytidylyltransferase [Burkholderiales bacterium]